MGVFKSMREVQKQSREIQRNTDSSAMIGGALERMRAAGDSMAAMAQSADVAASGIRMEATIAGVSETGMIVNFQPTLRVDLTVMPEGSPPYPASATQVIPPVYLAKATAGRCVPVRVDPADPQVVWLDWAAA